MASLRKAVLAPAAHDRVDGDDVRMLTEDWQTAATEPGACAEPAQTSGLDWMPAPVPGTAAGALRAAGAAVGGDLDAQDWWFRTSFDGPAAGDGEQIVLHMDGIATVAEVYLNGRRIITSDSMFAAHAVDVGRSLAGANELVVCCRALAPLLRARRRPRARWRTRLVKDGELRWFRTMLLGRAPGFAPGPAAVGPWRAVYLRRRHGVFVGQLAVRTRLEDGAGVLAVRATLEAAGEIDVTTATIELDGPSGNHAAQLAVAPDGAALSVAGELRIPSVRRWWPHTHGEPALHDVRLLVDGAGDTRAFDCGRVGFRSLAPGPQDDHDVAADGLQLHVNETPIFARGAVWTPVDPIGLAPGERELRRALQTVRDAGMNMLRVPGTAAYEQPAFHDLCDELGILLWQDLMFANLDYPFSDDAFGSTVQREATDVIAALASRPSTAVLCGNSEIEQQVAMLGLDPQLGRGEFFGETVPALIEAAGMSAIYVPSAPSGGDLPFRPDRGVTNYYGVGGYRRPLGDARAAGVRFAAECLAFANVPDAEAIEALLPHAPASIAVHHPAWKAGVPRDSGSGWDFDDIRDHYLRTVRGIDPIALRSIDHDRYLELSRAVTGEIMAEVFGEWRRSASDCGGGLVLWLRDLAAGAGWGLLDHRGEPKVAFHRLRRALAPIAVWTTDEGLGGIAVHVANDPPGPLSARLRVALYQDSERLVAEASCPLALPGHSAYETNVETLLGRFVDAGWAYRFGPPAHDLIVVSLEQGEQTAPVLLAQSMRFPTGAPSAAQPLEQVGLAGRASPAADGTVDVMLSTKQLAYGARVHVPGFTPADDAFDIEPHGSRRLTLHPSAADAIYTGGALTALNLRGRTPIELGEAVA